MTDVDELLRRDGQRWRDDTTMTPQVDWAALTAPHRTPRASWWMVVATAATAAAVVALAILVPSWLDRRSSAPTPAHRPSPLPSPSIHVLGGPASFVGIRSDGSVAQGDARTGEWRGMAVSEEGRQATALAVTGSGTFAYATFSEPRCQINVHRFHWTSTTTSEGTDAATVAGIKADAAAISPDGHMLALAIQPCTRPKDSVDDLVVVNLETRHQRRWTGYADASFLSGLQWAADNKTLAYVVNPCCGGGTEGPRLLDTTAAGTSYVQPRPLPIDETVGNGIVLSYGGQLAVIMGTEIRALSTTGSVGQVLGRGLPADVVTVRTTSAGLHLLLTTQSGKLYRWDYDGTLTPLSGHWLDAGW